MNLASAFDEMKELLRDIVNYIIQNKDSDISDESYQAKKINATINELKKSNISVPDELIKLKLSLYDQIDKVKDVERTRKELLKLLEMSALQLKDTVIERNVKKDNKKKIIINDRVQLIDLINTSILPLNVELYAYYKNKRYSAILTSDGSLEMTVNKKKKKFDNHRLAAIAITGYQVDTWKFWKLDFEGKPLTLDDYRKKYFDKKNKISNNDIN